MGDMGDKGFPVAIIIIVVLIMVFVFTVAIMVLGALLGALF
jgi:flagellar basal body-associated protein FliL